MTDGAMTDVAMTDGAIGIYINAVVLNITVDVTVNFGPNILSSVSIVIIFIPLPKIKFDQPFVLHTGV